jgi:hypothetical protein
MVEMGTFVAILLGNVVGGLLVAACRKSARTMWPGGAGPGAVGRVVASSYRPGPAHRPHAAHQLEPGHRDLAQPETGARQRGGVPLAAGHQLDVVLWRGVPKPVPQPCQGSAARQRAGGVAVAGGVLHRHRHRFSCCANRAQPPPRGNRPGAAGRHRHDGVRSVDLYFATRGPQPCRRTTPVMLSAWTSWRKPPTGV